jgi:hypothetical protein
VIGTAPPFSLAAPVFRYRAIAALAGRAALGVDREIALATLMAARIADGALGADPLTDASRASRAAGARVWFSTLTLPAATRVPIARLVDASESGDRSRLIEAFHGFAGIAAPMLDTPSRAELSDLMSALAAA